MKLAILSDIHDNVWALAAALENCQSAEALLCCGDLCSPFIIPILAEGLIDRPIHIVFGNNDADLFRITRQAGRFPPVQLHGAFFQGEVGGVKLAMNHYDDLARSVATGGQYQLVCYGHNHAFKVEQIGSTLTINPGTLLGYDPIHRQDVPMTFVLYDTLSGEATGYQVRPMTANLRGPWSCEAYP
jgi:putative phosphoesterase